MGDLRVIEGEGYQSLSRYKALLTGESPIDVVFLENFIDGVAEFLNDSVWNKFNQRIIVPADQLSYLIWKIKERREGHRPFLQYGKLDVIHVKMRESASCFLEKSFLDKWHMDVNTADNSKLVRVAGKLVARLEFLLHDLLAKHRMSVDQEKVLVQLLSPDYPLVMLVALSLWVQFGQVLTGFLGRINNLKYSLQVIGSPVLENQLMMESSYLALHRICGLMKAVTSCLNDGGDLDSERTLADLLKTCRIYPDYHRQISSAYLDLMKESQPVLDQGAPLLVGIEDEINKLRASMISSYLVSRRSQEYFPQDRTVEEDDFSSLKISWQEPGMFLQRKIRKNIEDLLRDGWVREAGELVRVEQLANNRLDYLEEDELEENFQEWTAREAETETLISTVRRRVTGLKLART